MVSRFERFAYVFSEITRHWHKIASDEMERYGLKGPYAVYLLMLYRHPDGLTSAQLSEKCGRDKSDVSRAVAALEKRELLEKETVNQSLYRALIKLTPEGKLAAKYICDRAGIAVELAGNGLTDENRAIFYDSLELIASNLRKVSEDGLPD